MSFKIFVLELISIFAALCLNFTLGDNCPPPEVILPCICMVPQSPLMYCSNITRPETIINIVEKTGGMKFRKFILANSSLTYLPTSALISEKFQALVITDSSLVSLFDKPPSAQNSLRLMFIMQVHLTRSVQWNLFQKLTKLEDLAFHQTDIMSLGDDFQRNISPSLTSLYMVETKTAKLGNEVFGNLKSLSVLHIRNSLLKVLKRSMFSKPAVIETLNLESNKIEFLPDDLFSDMPQLANIVLSSNRISILKEATFKGVLNQLETLVINGNPVKCDCEFKWIVNIQHSNIQGVCEEPEFRKGKPIRELKEEDFGFCAQN
ncbi:uncharacterized protein NPIL_607311 [Nephila pilipes]|uniref:Uncharacterized protein n=1 Tax=Nephila pilipes TaxID=299642 RepID=A0A8X6NZR3_NEPPI|nr:uncharacterized protein NPIL_607311 [Nephila pilipes]